MASGGRRGKVGTKKKKRKAKYLSLSRHLTKEVGTVELVSSPPSEVAEEEGHVKAPEEGGGAREQLDQQQQVEVFALHPEPSTLFTAASSLTDILGAGSSSGGSGDGGGGESSCGASPGDVSRGAAGRFAGEEEDLARRALRGRERWVYCGSAFSLTSATTTTTTTSSSCSSAMSTGASQGGAIARSSLLKLDFEEVLVAWAGRGSLYIGGAVEYAAVGER